MRVFITGSTGLIGRRVVRALLARGDAVVPLSRKPLPPVHFGPGSCEPVVGDPTTPGPWLDQLAACDAVVHLAGEPIAGKRWSDEFLKLVRRSRVDSTRLIAETLARSPRRAGGTPKVLVSGSGVGYYGANTGDAVQTESAPPGGDVLADICRKWEAAADAARAAGARVCHSRTGIVLDPAGGALPKMALPFKLFVGGRIGSGKQWMSWIHHTDMTGLLLFALDTPTVTGPFNAVAPTPVTNAEFSRTLAKVLRRPNLFPAPVFALRVLLGKVAEVVAGGQRATPKAALDAGYRFRFAELEAALREVLQ
ncbi:MAG: TIGR01777 family oxidoreductase [Gemmataceae bacterium]